MTSPILLKAGDILLYRAKGIYGRIITFHTGHDVGHVEIYNGGKKSWASRDGKGVNLYDLRVSELMYVIRATRKLDLALGREYGTRMLGTLYGWLDLLQFCGFNVNERGIVCSPFAAAWLRAAGWPVFPADAVEKVAPYQFLDLVAPGVCEIAYTPEQLRESLT